MSDSIQRAAIRVKAAREEMEHALKGLRTAVGLEIRVALEAYEQAQTIARGDENWLSTLILQAIEGEAQS